MLEIHLLDRGQPNFLELPELLGHHKLHADMKDYELDIGENKLVFSGSGSSFSYKRLFNKDVVAEAMIISKEEPAIIGVFPSAPLLTPKKVAKNVYLKFRSPVIVDQRQEAVVYAKMPIEIGIYRQSGDEEILLDAFSMQRQQYALYGSPENGVVCRYKETEVSTQPIEAIKYEEAVVKIHIKNSIDNIVKVSKVIIPMEGVILDHSSGDMAMLPGDVDVILDSAFGKDIVNVRLSGTKVKKLDKTSLVTKEDTLTFLMDAGY